MSIFPYNKFPYGNLNKINLQWLIEQVKDNENAIEALQAAIGELEQEFEFPIVNVKDSKYGAKGDGITNDTNAIQSAIDALAATGGVILFPRGAYINDGVTITTSGIHLLGEGERATRILLNDVAASSVWMSDVSNCSVSNMTLGAVEGKEPIDGAMLQLDKVAKCVFQNLEISDFYKGVLMRGGWVNNFEKIMAVQSDWFTSQSIAFFHLTTHPVEIGDWSPVNTKLARCDGAAAPTEWCQTGYLIDSGDWLQLSNCHFNKAVDGFKITTDTETRFISDVYLDACYIDECSRYNFVMEGASVGEIGGIKLADCFFRAGGVNNVNITYAGTLRQMVIDGCTFENAGETAIQYNPTTGVGLVIDGCAFDNFNINNVPTRFGIFVKGTNIVIANNVFNNTQGQIVENVIRRDVGSFNVSLTGNVIGSVNTNGELTQLNETYPCSVYGNTKIPDYSHPVTESISGGVIQKPTTKFMYVDTEGSTATDNLDTIVAGEQGQYVTLMAVDSNREIVVKHATGNLRLNGQADFTLSHSADTISFVYGNGVWCEVGRGDNNV